MKYFLSILFVAMISVVMAQDVTVSSERVQFTQGTFDAIVVSIPFASKDEVLKSLKSEMKAWGGKVKASKDEISSTNAKMKKMGEQYFNGYAKAIQDGDVVKVAFIVDLGGAYMTRMQHGDQYSYIEQRAKDFGISASKSSVKSTISDQNKALKALEKEKKSLEKGIDKSNKNIEKYKTQIATEEKNILDNQNAIKEKVKQISEQESIIKGSKSTLKSIN